MLPEQQIFLRFGFSAVQQMLEHWAERLYPSDLHATIAHTPILEVYPQPHRLSIEIVQNYTIQEVQL